MYWLNLRYNILILEHYPINCDIFENSISEIFMVLNVKFLKDKKVFDSKKKKRIIKKSTNRN